MEYKLTAPLSKADAAKLRAGDTVLLSGTIYTARDAAHKRRGPPAEALRPRAQFVDLFQKLLFHGRIVRVRMAACLLYTSRCV